MKNKKRIIGFISGAFVLTVFVNVFGASGVLAQEMLETQKDEPAGPSVDNESLKRWQGMSATEKEMLQKRYQEWKQLDPKVKDHIRQNFKRFRQLPPSEREKTRNNWKKFKMLSLERRQRVKERFEHWRTLPEEEQQRLRQRHEELLRMTPGQKQLFREKIKKEEPLLKEYKQFRQDHPNTDRDQLKGMWKKRHAKENRINADNGRPSRTIKNKNRKTLPIRSHRSR